MLVIGQSETGSEVECNIILFEHLQKQGVDLSVASVLILLNKASPTWQWTSRAGLAVHIKVLHLEEAQESIKIIFNQESYCVTLQGGITVSKTWSNHALNQLIITASTSSSSEIIFLYIYYASEQEMLFTIIPEAVGRSTHAWSTPYTSIAYTEGRQCTNLSKSSTKLSSVHHRPSHGLNSSSNQSCGQLAEDWERVEKRGKIFTWRPWP